MGKGDGIWECGEHGRRDHGLFNLLGRFDKNTNMVVQSDGAGAPQESR